MTVWLLGFYINLLSCGVNVSAKNYGWAAVSSLCALFCIAKLSIIA